MNERSNELSSWVMNASMTTSWKQRAGSDWSCSRPELYYETFVPSFHPLHIPFLWPFLTRILANESSAIGRESLDITVDSRSHDEDTVGGREIHMLKYLVGHHQTRLDRELWSWWNCRPSLGKDFVVKTERTCLLPQGIARGLLDHVVKSKQKSVSIF